jgi:hypothetical protein
MRKDLKESLRAEWPHIADDFIAVDEACSRWLKRREAMALRRLRDDGAGNMDGNIFPRSVGADVDG